MPDALLDDDRVEAEVGDTGSAVLLGDGEPEQADLPGLLPHLTRDDAVLLPLAVVWHDFTGHELAHGLLEEQVLFVEEVSPHQSPPSGGGRAGQNTILLRLSCGFSSAAVTICCVTSADA